MPLNELENGLPVAARCERSPHSPRPLFPRRCRRHYLFTPRDAATTTVQKKWQQQERGQTMQRDRGSETEFGHNSNLIRALADRAREREREGGTRCSRQQLYTSLDFYLRGERTSSRGRSFVRWHYEFGRSQSVRQSMLQHFREGNCVCGGLPIRIASRERDGRAPTRTYVLRISEIRAMLGNSAPSTTTTSNSIAPAAP